MKIQFYRLSDESVHILSLVGKGLCLLKFDYLVMVNAVFSHLRFFWLSETDVLPMFFNPHLNSATRLANIDLATFSENAVYSQYL
jgi:hypothetical protein